LLLLLSSCTLGPDYLRPKILIPDNHRGVVGTPAAESLADLPWWELFRDPVLQELTRESLQNNFDLRIAAARVEQARAQIGITRSFLFPQVNFSANGNVQQVSRFSEPPQSSGAGRTFRNLLLGFGLAWELDIFGRIQRETESATSVFLATEQAQRACLNHFSG
jgi:multidrug efflux system outer membrane protein